MSLQLPTILSPPTPCTPVTALTVLRSARSRSCRYSLPGSASVWASPLASRLANASGRIEFIIFLIMDWSFASGCSPPRLSATQFPSATDSQCSVRWGLPPHCWCALSGALAQAFRPGERQAQGDRPESTSSPLRGRFSPSAFRKDCLTRASESLSMNIAFRNLALEVGFIRPRPGKGK
jgi:hypothetical protein